MASNFRLHQMALIPFKKNETEYIKRGIADTAGEWSHGRNEEERFAGNAKSATRREIIVVWHRDGMGRSEETLMSLASPYRHFSSSEGYLKSCWNYSHLLNIWTRGNDLKQTGYSSCEASEKSWIRTACACLIMMKEIQPRLRVAICRLKKWFW